ARLGQREGRRHLARREPGQEPALLLLVARERDGVAAQVLHEEDRGGGGAGPRHFLGGEAERQPAGSAPAVLLGDVEAHQPLLRQELQLLVRVLAGLIDARGEGGDALARDLPREVADGALVVAQVIELVHALILAGPPARGPRIDRVARAAGRRRPPLLPAVVVKAPAGLATEVSRHHQ